ncbi:MAG: NAD(P)H-hydrate epimerase [Nitrososphaerales archaeon]
MKNNHQKSAVSVDEMTTLEMKRVDLGISKLIMMENAGASLAHTVMNVLKLNTSRKRNRKLRIAIVSGVGNNGGDCFVAARHLSYYSNLLETRVILVGTKNEIKTEEAAINFGIITKIPAVDIVSALKNEDIHDLRKTISSSDALIVGLFGTGFRGRPRELQSEIIKTINSSGVKNIISVDIPSGLDVQTGKAVEVVHSSVTVAMHAPKKCMVGSRLPSSTCGKIIVANIGLPF